MNERIFGLESISCRFPCHCVSYTWCEIHCEYQNNRNYIAMAAHESLSHAHFTIHYCLLNANHLAWISAIHVFIHWYGEMVWKVQKTHSCCSPLSGVFCFKTSPLKICLWNVFKGQCNYTHATWVVGREQWAKRGYDVRDVVHTKLQTFHAVYVFQFNYFDVTLVMSVLSWIV